MGSGDVKDYLVGPNISLCRFTERHITPNYMDWINDQKANRYLVMGRIPIARNEVEIPDYNKAILFAINANVDGMQIYVGAATIHNIDLVSSKAEVGYMFGEDFWGRGYATETVGLLTDYAFNRLNIRKINADVVSENPASMRVLEKNGFTKWGINPKDFYLEGEYLDNHMFYKLIEPDDS